MNHRKGQPYSRINNVDQDNQIDPVVDLLGGGRVIAYRPELARAVGDPLAALLLQQLWWWTNNHDRVLDDRTDANGNRSAPLRDNAGFVAPTQEIVEAATGLGRSSQETARKRLRSLGIIIEVRRGTPARVWYRVDKKRLYEVLKKSLDGLDVDIERDESSTGRKPNEPECTISAIQSAGIPQSSTLDSSRRECDESANRMGENQHPYIIRTHARPENSSQNIYRRAANSVEQRESQFSNKGISVAADVADHDIHRIPNDLNTHEVGDKEQCLDAIPSEYHALYLQLQSHGIDQQAVTEFVLNPELRAASVLQLQYLPHRKGIGTTSAYLVAAIRGQYSAPHGYKSQKKTIGAFPRPTQSSPTGGTAVASLPPTPSASRFGNANGLPLVIPDEWLQIMQLLPALGVNKPTMGTHIRTLLPLTLKDGHLTLGCQGEFTRNHLDKCCRTLIEQASGQILGYPVTVEFTVFRTQKELENAL